MILAGERYGPYRLLSPLGQGGMGEVFVAVDEREGREVALKLLRTSPERGRQSEVRFIQEARVLAQLDHPGIVRVFHCEQLDAGTLYLAMERLHGRTLRDWMRQHASSVPLADALEIARQISAAMVAVHAWKIVHRDLKPENIFLCLGTGEPPGHRVKVLDFGIAKVPPIDPGPRGDTQLQTDVLDRVGTIGYMAPEQCKGEPCESRTDVYALGLILFELLAGRPPFVSDNAFKLQSMHVNDEPPSLAQLAPGLPGSLTRFITAMLAKAPSERPTMEQCLERLGEPWTEDPKKRRISTLLSFTRSRATRILRRERILPFAVIITCVLLAFSALRLLHGGPRTIPPLVSEIQDAVGTDWDFSTLPHTLKPRHETLNQKREKLRNTSPDERAIPAMRKAHIVLLHRLGDMDFIDGSLLQAELNWASARGLIARALRSQPADAELHFLLGLNASKRGKLALARGYLDEAGRCFAEAHELSERALATAAPEDLVDAQRTLATDDFESAELAFARGRMDEAVMASRHATNLFEKINRGPSKTPYEQSLLAEALRAQGAAELRAGQLLAATAHVYRAFILLQELLQREPHIGYSRWVLAWVHLEFAALQQAQELQSEAALHHQEAERLGLELRRDEPDSKRYALVLLQALRKQEALALARGDARGATNRHTQRCQLMEEFHQKDAEDVRFWDPLCP